MSKVGINPFQFFMFIIMLVLLEQLLKQQKQAQLPPTPAQIQMGIAGGGLARTRRGKPTPGKVYRAVQTPATFRMMHPGRYLMHVHGKAGGGRLIL